MVDKAGTKARTAIWRRRVTDPLARFARTPPLGGETIYLPMYQFTYLRIYPFSHLCIYLLFLFSPL